VWADPDIGEATFYVIVEDLGGKKVASAPEVLMWVEPQGGRLKRQTYPMQRRPMRNQVQFEAQPHFDRRDLWKVGICLIDSSGDMEEITTQVESTPPGYGAWDFAVYLFPFVLLGGLWAFAMIRRFRARQQHGFETPGGPNTRSPDVQ
jgi:hypothetical protein